MSRSPVDPDLDLPPVRQRRAPALDRAVVAAIALGGVLGAEARYGLERAWPTVGGAWPAATFWTNVVGSALIGALMVVVVELTSPHRLLRPFLGVGVLGGFTTFSTAMVQVGDLAGAGRAGLAAGYLVGTAVTALVAAAAGVVAMRSLAAGARRVRLRRSR